MLLGQLLKDSIDTIRETHIQHFVSLIKHNIAHLIELCNSTLYQINQTTWSSNDNLYTMFQSTNLRADSSTAINSCDIKMIYISTDYVFDGEGTRPWEPDDKPDPLNVYGLTKYEGEVAVTSTLSKYFIVRIAWVFGLNGKNFIKTMLNLAKTHDSLTVVNDQFGSPTYTYDLARLLVDMVLTDKYGIYHATNEGIITWYDFACQIFKTAGLNVKVSPVPASEYPAKAKRPSNSRMSKQKLVDNGFELLPTWQDALERYIKILKENGF